MRKQDILGVYFKRSAKGADGRRQNESNLREDLGGEDDTTTVLRVPKEHRSMSRLAAFGRVARLFR